MRKHDKGLILFVGIILLGFLVGKTLLTVFVFGGLMLLGLIVLVENIPPLKWLLSRTSMVFDIVLFVFGVIAMVQYGYNIAGGLAIAGLGYSLYYGPKLRYDKSINQKAKKHIIPNGKDRFDFR